MAFRQSNREFLIRFHRGFAAVLRRLTSSKQDPLLAPCRSFFVHNPNPMWLFDLETLRFLEVNEAAVQQYGYSREEFLAMTIEDIRPADEIPLLRDDIARVRHESMRNTGLWRHRKKDGTQIDVEILANGLTYRGRPARLIMAHDVTERQRALEALRSAEESYRSIFENATEGIFQTSVDGKYLRVNPALARIYGYDTPDDLIRSMTDIAGQLYVEPRRRDEFARLLRANDAVFDFESQVRRRDGSVIWIRENARAVRDDEGNLVGFEGMVTDITERRRFEETIQWQAYHDSLTRLPNRDLFQLRLEKSILAAEEERSQGAVLFLDLDGFKHVNDSLGHDTGDLLLVAVAELLAGCLAPDDTLARMGGDEFTALLSRVDSEEEAAAAAQRLLDALSRPLRVGDNELFVDTSIGVSLFPRDGRNAATILKNADVALYRAKEQGGGRYRLFTQELNERACERMTLSSRLRRAIDLREFRLDYQPQVDLESGSVIGVEALVRWQHPQKGLLTPARFVPLAEETGLIVPLGEWVLEEACRQAVSWQRVGCQLRVSVNLSVRQFRQRDLPSVVEAILRRTGLEARWLELELTETALIENEPEAVAALHDLKALGVRIAIDDFGTGYSALSYLRRYPLDTLKMDQTFLRSLTFDSAEEAVIRAIMGVANALRLQTIAEGVETETQRRCLHQLGCTIMQGYLFSPPVPPDRIPSLVTDRRFSRPFLRMV